MARKPFYILARRLLPAPTAQERVLEYPWGIGCCWAFIAGTRRYCSPQPTVNSVISQSIQATPIRTYPARLCARTQGHSARTAGRRNSYRSFLPHFAPGVRRAWLLPGEKCGYFSVPSSPGKCGKPSSNLTHGRISEVQVWQLGSRSSDRSRPPAMRANSVSVSQVKGALQREQNPRRAVSEDW